MKVAAMFSGGKDSAYAAYLAKRRDDLVCLVTLRSARDDSYMFHSIAVDWTGLQARTAHLPQIVVPTEGEKEVELNDLSKALRIAKETHAIEGVYTGALASVYQKSRVDRICEEVGLQSLSPLWQIDPRTHLLNVIRDGFDVIVTGVSGLGLDEAWLGRGLDLTMVDELTALQDKYGLHAALEGGEGETFVLDCPLFEERIEIVSSRKHWDGMSGHLEILEARLVPKEQGRQRVFGPSSSSPATAS
jgi:diphthine-ammonia ligase